MQIEELMTFSLINISFSLIFYKVYKYYNSIHHYDVVSQYETNTIDSQFLYEKEPLV